MTTTFIEEELDDGRHTLIHKHYYGLWCPRRIEIIVPDLDIIEEINKDENDYYFNKFNDENEEWFDRLIYTLDIDSMRFYEFPLRLCQQLYGIGYTKNGKQCKLNFKTLCGFINGCWTYDTYNDFLFDIKDPTAKEIAECRIIFYLPPMELIHGYAVSSPYSISFNGISSGSIYGGVRSNILNDLPFAFARRNTKIISERNAEFTDSYNPSDIIEVWTYTQLHTRQYSSNEQYKQDSCKKYIKYNNIDIYTLSKGFYVQCQSSQLIVSNIYHFVNQDKKLPNKHSYQWNIHKVSDGLFYVKMPKDIETNYDGNRIIDFHEKIQFSLHGITSEECTIYEQYCNCFSYGRGLVGQRFVY